MQTVADLIQRKILIRIVNNLNFKIFHNHLQIKKLTLINYLKMKIEKLQ